MEKYEENLAKAINELKIADHMIYITYPIVKDKRLLLKALSSIYESITSTINAILQYDYIWKRIKLYANPKDNFNVFIEKCAKRYNLTENDIKQLIEFLELAEAHKKSPMEFLRRDKIIIMSDNLKTTSIDSEKLKLYLNFGKKILENTRKVIKPP
jgi:hypothetical protein